MMTRGVKDYEQLYTTICTTDTQDNPASHKREAYITVELPKTREQFYHGLPNLFRPLRVAAGESRYGDPFALVAIPPGSW